MIRTDQKAVAGRWLPLGAAVIAMAALALASSASSAQDPAVCAEQCDANNSTVEGRRSCRSYCPSDSRSKPQPPTQAAQPASPSAARVGGASGKAARKALDTALTFMKEVGCTQLPMGACELLDADNARGIMLTKRAILLEHFCGSRSEESSRQLLAISMANKEYECRALLELLKKPSS